MTMHFCFLQKEMIWYGSVKSWGGHWSAKIVVRGGEAVTKVFS